MKRIFVFWAAGSLLLAGCGGSRSGHEAAQAAVITGVALTAVAVQKAREQKQPKSISKKSSECCAVCGECEFPCGDTCIPQGILCTKPKGCACTQDASIPEGTPKPEPNPVPCNQSPAFDPTISM
ncbi:MAG: hypothetical protein JXX29_05190 [Deltaproteobacteria bacterium]|nr:hypothetical protein [Deltaproteobacteria bacterium]MBN2671042.1 hypothetical protein [Deltaproteobacteria bacterium]